MAKDSWEKTAFTLLPEVTLSVMHFSVTFQRMMNTIFGNVTGYVSAYMDDVAFICN